MFGLADCNNFFVSCERVFNPSLEGKPVLVLSNNDGCVISRSQEAKKLGIKMGEPVFKIRDLIKRERVSVFSCNFTLYGDMSQRVMETLRSVVPQIEVYSVDEAFLDLREIKPDSLKKFGEGVAGKVMRDTGIPISIGISKTKTLAKVAASIAKRDFPSGGCFFLDGQEEITDALKNCPAGDIWGIGRRLSSFLAGNGIFTAYDLVNSPDDWIKSRLTITGLRTWRELRGESCISFEEMPTNKKQICTSRSFPVEISELDSVYKALSYFVSNCAEKLRKQKSVCNEMIIFLLTNVYKKTGSEQYRSIVVQTESPTDSTIELIKKVYPALEKIFREGTLYKKGGVILTGITRKEETAGDIFCSYNVSRHTSLMECMDGINVKYGKDSIINAAQGTRPFKTGSANLSKKYTTDWADIITVKV